nr:phospholipase A2 homolog sphenotoxin basic subunit B-like isoform X2 [Chelonoidis abingdonii]XP_032635439.1 phospholipase A2 homolog sphenotoxin basic subunit B-like isoform X2 [Chelonoidis abingdonii]
MRSIPDAACLKLRGDYTRNASDLMYPAYGNGQKCGINRPCMKMKNLLVFAVLFAYGAVTTQGSLWELQKMIKQVTGKNALWNYSKYGCYCGSGGKGMPKDGTDQCCQLHDCCYHRLKGHGCNAKLNTYSYSYLSGRIYCGPSLKHASCYCLSAGLGSWCKRESCRCDSDFVLCLKKHVSSYKTGYRFYRKSRCGGEELRC